MDKRIRIVAVNARGMIKDAIRIGAQSTISGNLGHHVHGRGIVTDRREMLPQEDFRLLQLLLVDQSPRLGDIRRRRFGLPPGARETPLISLHRFAQLNGRRFIARRNRDCRAGLIRGIPQLGFRLRDASVGF
jgi:hypothetical protein